MCVRWKRVTKRLCYFVFILQYASLRLRHEKHAGYAAIPPCFPTSIAQIYTHQYMSIVALSNRSTYTALSPRIRLFCAPRCACCVVEILQTSYVSCEAWSAEKGTPLPVYLAYHPLYGSARRRSRARYTCSLRACDVWFGCTFLSIPMAPTRSCRSVFGVWFVFRLPFHSHYLLDGSFPHDSGETCNRQNISAKKRSHNQHEMKMRVSK